MLILPQSMLYHKQNHVMLDRITTALDCMHSCPMIRQLDRPPHCCCFFFLSFITIDLLWFRYVLYMKEIPFLVMSECYNKNTFCREMWSTQKFIKPTKLNRYIKHMHVSVLINDISLEQWRRELCYSIDCKSGSPCNTNLYIGNNIY